MIEAPGNILKTMFLFLEKFYENKYYYEICKYIYNIWRIWKFLKESYKDIKLHIKRFSILKISKENLTGSVNFFKGKLLCKNYL